MVPVTNEHIDTEPLLVARITCHEANDTFLLHQSHVDLGWAQRKLEATAELMASMVQPNPCFSPTAARKVPIAWERDLVFFMIHAHPSAFLADCPWLPKLRRLAYLPLDQHGGTSPPGWANVGKAIGFIAMTRLRELWLVGIQPLGQSCVPEDAPRDAWGFTAYDSVAGVALSESMGGRGTPEQQNISSEMFRVSDPRMLARMASMAPEMTALSTKMDSALAEAGLKDRVKVQTVIDIENAGPTNRLYMRTLRPGTITQS